MCEHRKTVAMEVLVDASIAFEGYSIRKQRPIDSCIADIVAALDGGDVPMLGSCCGHFDKTGEILLVDGRILTISKAKSE